MNRSILRSLVLGLVAAAPISTYLVAPNLAQANLGFETGVVSGNITRSDGSPVAFAEVQITANDGSGSAWTSTDANGDYSLEVPTGDYDITPIYPDFWIPIGTSTVAVAQGGTSTADFVQDVGTLSGTLLRSNGAAFTGAEVWLSSEAGGGGSLAVELDGSFSGAIPVGDWTLSGRYNGFPVATDAATIVQGGSANAVLTFPSGEVTANVTANGAPETGARMWISQGNEFTGSCPADAETTCEWFEPGDPNAPPEMEQDMCGGCTDDDGRRFNCEHDGMCWWEETFNGYAQADANGDLALVLPTGDFHGQVQVEYWHDQGDPQQPDPGFPYWGSFTFDDFDISVIDESVEARPPIAFTTGTVGGKVTLDGLDVAHAQIEFNVVDGAFFGWASVQTDANGDYSIDLPDGDYELRATGNGLNVEGVPVTVLGDSQVVDLSETSSGGPGSFLRGTVLRNGLAQANVQVHVMDSTPPPSACPADPELCEWHEAQDWPEGEPIPPEHQIHCDRCDDGEGRIYACQGDIECWWEEPYSVSAQTGPDGTWSVAAPSNPYTVSLLDHFYGDPQQMPEGENGEFWSEFVLTTYDVVLGVDDDQDLGTYAYDTGFVSGAITSCDEPETSAAASVSNDTGWSWSSTGQDASFSMEVPTGTYDASLDYGYAFYQWPAPVVVTAGATATLDHAFEGHGVLSGFVSSNGAPVQGARVDIQEPPPAGCEMEGANCWELEPEFCHCEFEGRGFECWSHDPGMPELQECYWYDSGGNTAYTDSDGTFTARVRPGQYNVTAYTPEVHDDPQDPEGDPGMGSGGSFAIGTLQASIFTCQTSEVGAADTPIEAIPPGGTSTVELTPDLTIELASVDGAEAGTVSFVATNEEPIDEQPAGLIDVASLYYDFTSTVEFDQATVCIPYDEAALTVPEADLKMLHYDDLLDPAQWVDVTTSVDTVNDIVCGITPHFSWHVLVQVEASDNDGDGVEQDVDNCPEDANADQLDLDGDGEGDVCDDDVDGDSVFNAFDDCAVTPLENLADENGCDSAQRLDANCPNDGDYKNHGQYVSCVSNETDEQVSLGLLDAAEAEAIVSEAAHSDVGKNKGE